MTAERVRIGLGSAVALVVANMIGAGVFTSSGFALSDLRSADLVLFAWCLGGLHALAGALTYASLASRFPSSGGEYVYVRETLHPALGRLAGCRVVGVVGSTHKIEACLANGAERAIDKSVQDLWHEAEAFAPAGFHAIFDANGVSTLRDSYQHLAATGVLAIYGFHSMLPRDGRLNRLQLAWDWCRTPRFNPLRMTQENRSVIAANLSFLQSEAPRLREGMHWLLERFADGQLKPLPVTTFALANAAGAQRAIESGKTVGKLALIP